MKQKWSDTMIHKRCLRELRDSTSLEMLSVANMYAALFLAKLVREGKPTRLTQWSLSLISQGSKHKLGLQK
jgi:hypothetical protein